MSSMHWSPIDIEGYLSVRRARDVVGLRHGLRIALRVDYLDRWRKDYKPLSLYSRWSVR